MKTEIAAAGRGLTRPADTAHPKAGHELGRVALRIRPGSLAADHLAAKREWVEREIHTDRREATRQTDEFSRAMVNDEIGLSHWVPVARVLPTFRPPAARLPLSWRLARLAAILISTAVSLAMLSYAAAYLGWLVRYLTRA